MDPLTAILNAPGGWIVFVLGLGVVGALFVKGTIVARFVYDREVERGDKITKELAKTNDSLDRLTDEIRWSNRGHPPR